jgi:putative FmdB family regulatory protein
MPIYEYLCRACGRETERLQKLSDNPLTDCPDCGQPALVRKISAPSFRLKGGGWYETDFKSDKEKKRNLAGDVTKPSEAKSGDAAAKTEAKPETKPAAAKPAAASKAEAS